MHVTNGDSVGGTLHATSLGGDVLVWRDVLHAGPSRPAPPDLFLDALHDDRVVLWFEHDLYDQLQLVETLAVAHELGHAPELIVIGSFPGRPSFRGLGELTADELESLWPARERASDATLAAAKDVWDAYCAPNPIALAEHARRAHAGLPYLGAALRRLLAELPAPGDGLSATERFALQAIADGAATPVAAFLAAQNLEDAPFLGDTAFFHQLAALAPLVAGGPGSLRLTREGERVLAGELDRVELIGIDRWVGGTHVTPDSVWRWDPIASRLQR